MSNFVCTFIYHSPREILLSGRLFGTALDNAYIHTTYHLRLIPEGIVEATKDSQILHRDAYVLPKLFGCEEYCRRDSQ
jgi:hypothetical protein